MERLIAVSQTLDGFELARIDLEQRKEGDVLGSSQSGGKSHLRLLRVLRDEDLIESAREDALDLLKSDPTLSKHVELLSEVAKLRDQESSAFMDKS
jgi:ATP-dependent DNA helicase RecG